ncbi:nicotinate-nucleotide adenylyltransferase [Streptomyces griseoloalbus]
MPGRWARRARARKRPYLSEQPAGCRSAGRGRRTPGSRTHPPAGRTRVEARRVTRSRSVAWRVSVRVRVRVRAGVRGRAGPTPLDTLRDLAALNPDTDLFFITGADALAQILTWRDSEELFSLAHFIGVTRPGHHLTDAGLPEGGVSLVEVPALAISSTDCRARVAKGDPVWYLVPDGVVRYIAKRQLYRGE